MEKSDKIYIAGHQGLVGSALLNKLKKDNYKNLLTKTSSELDLTRQKEVEDFFALERPAYVFLAAAKVGGIQANDRYSGQFIYDNLMIQTNVLHSAYQANAKKLVFLGSSCIYPKYALQPIKEEYLMNGKLETTNEAYAVAKIAGIMTCRYYNKQYDTNFISVMPTNLYGPNDHFDLENSHVLPALIRKIHEAKIEKRDNVVIWGTGKPRREFLHVSDLANALVYLMNNYDSNEIINIGTGKDISINELAEMVKEVVGFEGKIINDISKPDGTFQKLLDTSKLHKLGWRASIGLRKGIEMTYQWFQNKSKFI